MYAFKGGIVMSGISNKTKRRLTCQFCPTKNTCKKQCKKGWKKIYHEHRDEILEINRRSKSRISQ